MEIKITDKRGRKNISLRINAFLVKKYLHNR